MYMTFHTHFLSLSSFVKLTSKRKSAPRQKRHPFMCSLSFLGKVWFFCPYIITDFYVCKHFLGSPLLDRWSCTRGVQPFGVSGPHWKKKSCLGPRIKHTKTNENWWEKKKKVLSKFTILCWATFIAIPCCMQPVDRGLDTPASVCERMTTFTYKNNLPVNLDF